MLGWLGRVHLWRSPLGYHYLKDPTGTLDVTPDPERLRLAKTFVAHVDTTTGPAGPADPAAEP